MMLSYISIIELLLLLITSSTTKISKKKFLPYFCHHAVPYLKSCLMFFRQWNAVLFIFTVDTTHYNIIEGTLWFLLYIKSYNSSRWVRGECVGMCNDSDDARQRGLQLFRSSNLLYFSCRCEKLPAPGSAAARWSSEAAAAMKTPDPWPRNPAWLLSLKACLN